MCCQGFEKEEDSLPPTHFFLDQWFVEPKIKEKGFLSVILIKRKEWKREM